jgi:hypothetical protein
MSATRRSFAKAAAITAVSYSRIRGANERVRLGFVGVGNHPLSWWYQARTSSTGAP